MVDIPQLVRKYELTGGNIINIIHYAGIRAVESLNSRRNAVRETDKRRKVFVESSGTEIEDVQNGPMRKSNLIFYLSDVLEGIKRELLKGGKPFAS